MHGELATGPDGQCSSLGLPCILSVILSKFLIPLCPFPTSWHGNPEETVSHTPPQPT